MWPGESETVVAPGYGVRVTWRPELKIGVIVAVAVVVILLARWFSRR